MEIIELRFENMTPWFEAIGLVSLILLVITALELVWDIVSRHKKTLWETGANIVIAVGNGLLERTVFGSVFLIALLIAEEFAIAKLSVNAWTWVAAILIADFSYYWMHRIEHRVRVLWAYHSVHHSSHEFDLTTAFRLSWMEGLFEWVFFVPMVLIGFDAVQALVAILIVIVYQTWIHTQKVGKLGWLDGVLNTPSAHRVHHGQNPQYIDKNYGGIFIVWDRLFGTYEPEGEPVVFGITKPPESANPVTINFYEFMRIAKDCRTAKSLNQAWRFITRPPGWQPESASY